VIASVRGRVASVSTDSVVVEVGGVGLAVHCVAATLASLRPGAEVRLATSLIVREDALTLYGFAADDEKHMFDLLLTASGVGPKLAQSVLAVHAPDAVRKAIANADIGSLTRVPGIGRKGAERMIIELRDRIGPVPLGEAGEPGVRAMAWQDQVRQALVGLGWTTGQADQAVTAVGEGITDEVPPVQILLKQAIRLLGRAR
jgi:holliday junction DNA helicase RuvA